MTRRPIQLSDEERNIVHQALTMMIQEVNSVAQWVYDMGRAETLNQQPLSHSSQLAGDLVEKAGQVYDLRERFEEDMGDGNGHAISG